MATKEAWGKRVHGDLDELRHNCKYTAEAYNQTDKRLLGEITELEIEKAQISATHLLSHCMSSTNQLASGAGGLSLAGGYLWKTAVKDSVENILKKHPLAGSAAVGGVLLSTFLAVNSILVLLKEREKDQLIGIKNEDRAKNRWSHWAGEYRSLYEDATNFKCSIPNMFKQETFEDIYTNQVQTFQKRKSDLEGKGQTGERPPTVNQDYIFVRDELNKRFEKDDRQKHKNIFGQYPDE
eukprot:CAMPEP_0174240042 /NCGR_PEP_ID=MMETSP0417-20130205/17216_1 /TAXON_ID=242541 /ORGANISM="Mayorella sp, Strain BSH-02190019" /LENGTH=237 /DNA_ID=CAMNT_0015319067 /DNA_START=31 /DNA_END=744 /DNA_ORIENTATION=-